MKITFLDAKLISEEFNLKFLKSFIFFNLLTLSFIDITLSVKTTSAFIIAFLGLLNILIFPYKTKIIK